MKAMTITINPSVDKSSSVKGIVPEKNYVVISQNTNLVAAVSMSQER